MYFAHDAVPFSADCLHNLQFGARRFASLQIGGDLRDAGLQLQINVLDIDQCSLQSRREGGIEAREDQKLSIGHKKESERVSDVESQNQVVIGEQHDAKDRHQHQPVVKCRPSAARAEHQDEHCDCQRCCQHEGWQFADSHRVQRVSQRHERDAADNEQDLEEALPREGKVTGRESEQNGMQHE